MFPRSFGLSFAVPADKLASRSLSPGVATRTGTLRHDLTRARGSAPGVAAGQVTHRLCCRLGRNRRLKNPPWADQPDVHLRTVCRRRGDRFVVELALVNDQAEPDRRRDTAWLFQTRLEVTAVEGAPSSSCQRTARWPAASIQEDQHLAMLYRHALEYAVGRNVAVAVQASRNSVAPHGSPQSGSRPWTSPRRSPRLWKARPGSAAWKSTWNGWRSSSREAPLRTGPARRRV